MQNYILVAIGAALGGMLRYWSTNTIQKLFPFIFPSGTLFVNFLGSFLLGFILFYFDAKELLSHQMKIFLTIGFCGGLTTFSAFSYETVALLRDSEILFCLVNIFLNVFFSILAVMLSYIIAKIISGG